MRDGEKPAQQAQEQAGDDFAITPLDGAPATPRGLPLTLRALRGQRRRVAAVAATTLLVVMVVVGLFARATSDPGGALATLLLHASPTPDATFVPGANAIYFSNGAPWGTLTLDGARLPSADLTGQSALVTPGAHHLVYQARYFPSLRCTFSAPRAQSDTCPLDTSDTAEQFLLSHGLARAIDLGSTGSALQPDQLSALTRLADDLLKAQTLTTTIAPGERYLDGQWQIVTASAPLHFTLTLALGAGEGPTASAACSQFCPDPAFATGDQPPGGGWLTQLTVISNWAITDDSGRRLTPLNYQAGQQFPSAEPVEVRIQLTPTGWQINGLENWNEQVVGLAVGNLVQQAVDAANSGAGFGDSLQFAPNPLDGCVMDVTYGGATSRVLWRFGALLAVDATAHRIFPQLPVATAAEQALAYHIASQPPTLRDDSILPTSQS